LLLQRLRQLARTRCHLVVKPFAFEAGTNPGAQQSRIEGLGQVVLGAEFDTANDTVDLIDRGNQNWKNSPFGRRMPAISAPHSLAADSTSVLSTALRSKVERLIGGGLLLQRFAQLVEQAGVLDGDDGLRGEIRNQGDLLVGERSNVLVR
jgi:hypothetical protein